MSDYKERLVSEEIAQAHMAYLTKRGDMYNPQNPFSKILRGEMPAKIVKETPYAVIIQNQIQRTKIYNLALPVYPAKDLFDFAEHANQKEVEGYANAIQECVQEIFKTSSFSKKDLKASCARIIFNIGPYSQNTVPHLHAHILADDHFVEARHLTLSQESAEKMDMWIKTQSNPTIASYETTMNGEIETGMQIENKSDEQIKLLPNGQKLGWKDSFDLRQPTVRTVFDFIRFLKVVATLSSQNDWGGRAVIDVTRHAGIMTHVSGDRLLRKLPLTPLTKEQLMANIQNIHG